MSTSIEPIIANAGSAEPENLGSLQLAAERKHDRPSALRRRAAGAWQDTPDWRFHRQLMRVGLYLRERAGVEAGDRVALLSALRPEWAVALWGSLAQGVGVALMNPDVPDADFAAKLTALAPRAVFADEASLDRVLRWRQGGHKGEIIALDASPVTADGRPGAPGVVTWTEALDLGGSLDTAERANAFRALVRAVAPETPALGHAVGSDGSVAWRFSSHRDVVRRVQRVWSRARIARGDTAYAAIDVPTIAAAVEILAFTADGHTQITFGNAGQALEEMEMTRPHKIMTGPDIVRRLVDALPPAERSLAGMARRWLAGARLPRLPRIGRPSEFRRDEAEGKTPLERARWISTGPALEFALRARARKLVTLEIDDSLA